MKQFNGVRGLDLTYRVDVSQNKNDQKQHQHRADHFGGDKESKGDGRVDQVAEQQKQDFIQGNTDDKSSDHTEHIQDDGLPGESDCQMALLHAENIVETEFLLSPLHQKAVRIEEKDHGEDQDDSATKSQNLLENNCADHIGGKGGEHHSKGL